MGLVAIALIQLAVASTVTTGPFSIDDVIYRLMTESTANGFGLFVHTGHVEITSPELLPLFVDAASGGSTAQYPNGYALLAAPFLSTVGATAFPLLNSIAFLCCVVLCYSTGHRVLGDRFLAVVSAALFGFATFAWEYSVGIWPHMVTLAFGVATFRLVLTSLDLPANRSAPFWAGLLGGLGMTIRFDAALLLAIAAWILVWDDARNWGRLASFAAGITPAVAFLAWTNYVKWDTLTLFTYGPQRSLSVRSYGPLLLVLTVVVAVVVVLQRVRLANPTDLKRRTAIVFLVGLIASLSIEPSRRFVLDVMKGLWILVVDIRSLDEYSRPGLLRTETGGVVYAGTLKKAILQSAPFLIAPLAIRFNSNRSHSKGSYLGYLALPLVLYPLMFAPWAWHGGQSFSMRYLLPVLPFASILVAAAIGQVGDMFGVMLSWGYLRRVIIGVLILYIAFWALDSGYRESTYLVVPLLLASLTALAALAMRLRPSEAIGRLFLVFLTAGVAWASVTTFSYDVPRSLSVKDSNETVATQVGSLIQDSSLLLAEWPDDLYASRWLHGDVIVALPHNDSFQDVPFVIRTAEAQGRTVFGALTEESWIEIHRSVKGSWSDLGSVGKYIVRRLDG